MQCLSLVTKANIQQTIICQLVCTGETPKAESVVDRNTNDRFANFDRLLYDEGEVVSLISPASCNQQLVAVFPGA
jgi:hypothetical protein